MSRIFKWLRDAWLICGTALLLLVCLLAIVEAVTSAWVARGVIFEDALLADPRMDADDYRGKPWSAQFFREAREVEVMTWASYVYWRHKPYAGRYINVGDDGLRLTKATVSPAGGRRRPLLIYFFGGSTMWGSAARDEHTIPSLAACGLNARGIDVEAVNFGEAGYVSTQGLIKLMIELRQGRRPDLVVFYDGINDTGAAMQSLVAGIPQNERNRAEEFNLTLRDWGRSNQRKTALMLLIKHTNTFRLAERVRRLLTGDADDGYPKARTDYTRELAEQVIRIYRENMRLVASLGESYGFKTLFYWQPVIFTKPSLSEYEAIHRADNPISEAFFRETYRLVDAATDELAQSFQFRNLAGIFAESAEPVYVDWAHLSERGNARIAGRMVEDIAAAGLAPRPR